MTVMMMIRVIYERKEGITLARSARLAGLFKTATMELKDAEVETLTGLSFATWQRMKTGLIVSDEKIIQFCDAMGLDVEEFLSVAHEDRPGTDYRMALSSLLNRAGLSNAARMKMLALFEDLRASSDNENASSSAA